METPSISHINSINSSPQGAQPATERFIDEYPSAGEAYKRLSEALARQDSTYEFLIGRNYSILTFATAIVGIGLPLGLTLIPEHLRLDIVPWVVSGVPASVFAVLLLFAYKALDREGIQLLEDPVWLRENFWRLSREEFLSEMLGHMEDAHVDNLKVLNKKLAWYRRLRATAVILTILVLAYVGWVSGIKVLCNCG